MGFQDRQYRPRGEEGGFRRALRRVFFEGDNFFAWAVPLFTVAGIRVKLHFFFLLYIAGELVVSMDRSGLGLAYRAIALGSLFTLVLLHEFGHCFACRWVRGEADEILLWPLGGLASCHPPHSPRAQLITTLGGPMVNLVLAPVLGLTIIATGGPAEMLLYNPFRPWATVVMYDWFNATGGAGWWHVALWSAYTTNNMLFLFNMLTPMYPMDAGRVLQELLWFRVGYVRSKIIAVNVGLVFAVVLGVTSAWMNNNKLMTLAIFCGLTCWQERQRVRVLEEDGVPGGYDFREYAERNEATRRGPSKREQKRQQETVDLQVEVDRILAKIATQGMGSLTKKEKQTLQGETERKRNQAMGR